MATINYCEKTKEELIEVILELERKNRALEQEVTDLKKKNIPKFVKVSIKKKRRKTPGRKVGHLGITRTKPDHIDETIESRLSTCPDCQHILGKPVDSFVHLQEDIIPAHVKVTCYTKYRYWCSGCQKMVTAPYHETEIPHSFLGPNALIHAALLKYQHHLPYESIKEIFTSFAGLTITEGALAQSLQRLSTWLKVEETAIIKGLRAANVVHMDETGWRIDGTNHWLWNLVNQRLAYYQIDRSRSGNVAEGMLGKNFQGTLITDFYSAYRKIKAKKQKCIVHLLREMDRCRVSDRSEEFTIHYKKLKRILTDAHRLKEKRSAMEPLVFYRRLTLLKERLLNFSCAEFRNKNWQRLSKRLLDYYEEIFTFVDNPAVSADNNHAERLIRPHVINRNRSFGNRSRRGATAHTTNMSILHSLKLQKRNLFESFKYAYLRHRQAPQNALLF
jgi:transposase